MNDAYMSGMAALVGSATGALASFATTWLTQHKQERAQRFARATALRHRLYGEFIEEASKLFTDALTHELDDLSKFVPPLRACREIAALCNCWRDLEGRGGHATHRRNLQPPQYRFLQCGREA